MSELTDKIRIAQRDAGEAAVVDSLRDMGLATEAPDSEHKEFAAKLTLMMNEAGQRGLMRTMHALHEAGQACGWEMAEQLKAEAEQNTPPLQTDTGDDDRG